MGIYDIIIDKLGEINMVRKNKILSTVFLAILISVVSIQIGFANSAEPPSILIIVPGAPKDMVISIETEDSFSRAAKVDKLTETYYTFYSRDIRTISSYNFKISTGDTSYEITLDEPIRSYNNIYTLDLKNETLKPGKLLSRSIALVSIRIILTLLIESYIFRLFHFKQKSSWIAFFIINLVTQGALNIWINGFPPITSYLIIILLFAEIIILITEIFLFAIFVKEHSMGRRILYVVVANILSLIAGGFIITLLPL